MTITPKKDSEKHVLFIAEYDDGSVEMFAVRRLASSPLLYG